MKQYLLIFHRALTEDEQNRIRTICGAQNDANALDIKNSYLFELLSFINHDVSRRRPSALRIETCKPPSMVMLLDELAPVLILEMGNGSDTTIHELGYALNKYLDYRSHIAEISDFSSSYRVAHQNAFDEQPQLDDEFLISEIDARISDEGNILKERIKQAIETFKPKNE